MSGQLGHLGQRWKRLLIRRKFARFSELSIDQPTWGLTTPRCLAGFNLAFNAVGISPNLKTLWISPIYSNNITASWLDSGSNNQQISGENIQIFLKGSSPKTIPSGSVPVAFHSSVQKAAEKCPSLRINPESKTRINPPDELQCSHKFKTHLMVLHSFLTGQ